MSKAHRPRSRPDPDSNALAEANHDASDDSQHAAASIEAAIICDDDDTVASSLPSNIKDLVTRAAEAAPTIAALAA